MHELFLAALRVLDLMVLVGAVVVVITSTLYGGAFIMDYTWSSETSDRVTWFAAAVAIAALVIGAFLYGAV